MDYLYLYSGGVFTACDPLGLEKADDVEESLKSQGYSPSQAVGDDLGLHYVLYEHSTEGWVVLFATAGLCSWTLCRSWPDLVGLLHTLSTTVLAGVLNSEPIHRGGDYSRFCYLPVRVIP